MTQKEYDDLTQILGGKAWEVRAKIAQYMKTVTIAETPKATRTSDQNAAMHVWFKQIADACRDAGIDNQLLFSKTIDLEVTPESIKTLWRAAQRHYYKTNSTKELKKHGEIDKIIDTLTRFFAERHTLEIPPFPYDPYKNNPRLQAMDNISNQAYPEYTGAPTI